MHLNRSTAVAQPVTSSASSGLRTTPHGGIVSHRDEVLDFVKGTLVLFMVLYHWLNYYIGFQWSGYVYLRFLTPSFIFITGFLISRSYLTRYRPGDSALSRRLTVRAGKLFALFVILNVVETILVPYSDPQFRLRDIWTGSRIGSALITGDAGTAFSILLPIAYLLALTPLLLRGSEAIGVSIPVLSVAAVISALALDYVGAINPHIELLAIGCLGLGVGKRLPSAQVDFRNTTAAVIGYAAYLVAIRRWGASFPLQVVGVPLTIWLIYAFGNVALRTWSASRQVILLGQYSLFAYVAQIAILRILRLFLQPDTINELGLAFILVLATALTLASVHAVIRVRRRYRYCDYMYRAVFN
jgi:hypothetical protein